MASPPVTWVRGSAEYRYIQHMVFQQRIAVMGGPHIEARDDMWIDATGSCHGSAGAAILGLGYLDACTRS